MLVPLGAQILDVCEAKSGRRAWLARRGRLSGGRALGLLDRRDPAGLPRQGAHALEGLRRLLGLPGLLVSPARGLLVFCPFLIFIPVGLARRLRTPSSRRLAIAFSPAVVAQLLT